MGWHIHFSKAFYCLSLNMYDIYKQKWWGLELYSEVFWENNRQLKAWRNWQYISTKSVKYTSMKYINVLLIFTHPRQPYPSCVYTQGLAWDIVIYSLLSIYMFHSHLLYIPLSIGLSFEYTQARWKAIYETKTC